MCNIVEKLKLECILLSTFSKNMYFECDQRSNVNVTYQTLSRFFKAMLSNGINADANLLYLVILFIFKVKPKCGFSNTYEIV